ADVMAFLLVPDNLPKPFHNPLVAGCAAQQRLQIVLRQAEEAGADFAVGGQSEAVAMSAERLAHRRDQADLPATVGEGPAPGGFRGIDRLNGAQLEARLETLQYFAPGNDQVLLPRAAGIQRHEFDKAQTQAPRPRELPERLDFVVIEPADDD